jgi:hypothetical protein
MQRRNRNTNVRIAVIIIIIIIPDCAELLMFAGTFLRKLLEANAKSDGALSFNLQKNPFATKK